MRDMILFIDTETSGMPNFKAPSDAPEQPHLLQLAAILTDDDCTVQRGLLCTLLAVPEDVRIEPEAQAVHGITGDTCRRNGVPLRTALNLLFAWGRLASRKVAHSANFDRKILRIAATRAGYDRATEIDSFDQGWFCTMMAARPVLKLPMLNGKKGTRFPSLVDCLDGLIEGGVHSMDRVAGAAHDALWDVRACRRVYHALQQKGIVP